MSGWKLVPVEPTDEMYCDGDEEIIKHLDSTARILGPETPAQSCWRAMVAKAPYPTPSEHSDLLERLRRGVVWPLLRTHPNVSETDKIIEEAATALSALAAERDALKAENFALAADQCHDGYGDERGNHQCRHVDAERQLVKIATDRARAAEAERDALRRERDSLAVTVEYYEEQARSSEKG